MKIAYVITKSNFGGAQRYVRDLAQHAQEKGCEPILITGQEGSLTREFQEMKAPFMSLPYLERDITLLKEWQALKDLYKIFRKEKPDVVHVNSSKTGGLGALAARLARVRKIVFTAHGWPFNEERPLWAQITIWFFSWLTCLLSTDIITITTDDRKEGRKMPFVSQKIQRVYNGVEDFSLLPREESRGKLWTQDSTYKWIGTVSELHLLNKGIDDLIRAFFEVKKVLPKTKLIIMGDGEDREKLQILVKSHNLEESVHFTGFMRDARRYMRALDLFVLPSRKEGLPYVLLEAGIAALPAIGSDVGGIPDIIENERTGLLVHPNRKTALAKAIVDALKNKDGLVKMGENLRAKVLNDFSREEMLKQTFEIYTLK